MLWWYFFFTYLGVVYTLYYHDYKVFYLYLQYGTTITPEKTKQAMEMIQSVLVEKLDKKFDHVEVSTNLFYVQLYIILHIVGKFLLAKWFLILQRQKLKSELFWSKQIQLLLLFEALNFHVSFLSQKHWKPPSQICLLGKLLNYSCF